MELNIPRDRNGEFEPLIIQKHQIRYTTKFVSYKDIKALMADLKRVYTASTEDIAKLELEAFSEKWDENIRQY